MRISTTGPVSFTRAEKVRRRVPKRGAAMRELAGLRTASLAEGYKGAILAGRDLGPYEEALRSLEAQAIETSVFSGPDFLVSAARHLRDADQPAALLVWQQVSGAADHLVALWPLQASRQRGPGAAVRAWSHPLSGGGAPLIARDAPEAIIAASLRLLARLNHSERALRLSGLWEDGPFMSALTRLAAEKNLPLVPFDRHRRAVFSGEPTQADESGKGGKDLRRLARRLAEQGSLTFSMAETYADIRTSAEEFLALEAAGWKGQAGTALVQNIDTANFTRALTWSMAQRNSIRIARLDLDGRMVAGGILFLPARSGVLWKIAYDENLARFSPGVQLVAALSTALREAGGIDRIDSCAMAGHAMIESLWPGRAPVCDLLIGLAPDQSTAFKVALARERLRRRLRAGVKHWFGRLKTPVP